MSKIKVNPFAMRQIGVTQKSEFGGFTGTAEELEQLLQPHLTEAFEGNRPYVRIINFTPPKGEGKFLCTYGVIHPDNVVSVRLETRRDYEAPSPVKYMKGDKTIAGFVEVVLYSTEELKREGDETAGSDGDWEVISLNCRPTQSEEPQNPWTMFRNWFASNPQDPRGKGGSPYPASKSPQEFIHELYTAALYWSVRAKIMA